LKTTRFAIRSPPESRRPSSALDDEGQIISPFKCAHKVIPNEAGIQTARTGAIDALRHSGLDEQYLFPIELSLQEALVNALVHGVGECDASQIWLSYEFDTRCVRITVEDDGHAGQKMGSREPIQGARLGLILIHGLMSRVTITSAGHGIRMELDCGEPVGSSSGAILPIKA
jgi:anti-sigma regulatory factor (Ser/Thr protein kinase)